MKYLIRVVYLAAAIALSVQQSGDSSAIHNCEIYHESTRHLCARCAEGYIVTSSGKQCDLKQDSYHSNCLEVGLFNECQVCECGYSYDLFVNECILSPAFLHGCQKIQGESCIQPKSGFQLLLSPEESFRSIQFSMGTHCEIITVDGDCLQCHHGYLLTSSNVCTKAAYEIQNSYFSYFENGTLRSRDMRLVAIENGVYPIIHYCVEYIVSSDNMTPLCSKCEKNRTPNQSKTSCHRVPFELCSEVMDSNYNQCTQCIDPQNYYILDLSSEGNGIYCVPRSRNLYDSCMRYEERGNNCLQCRKPFVLVENQCIIKNEQVQRLKNNCLIFDEENRCVECDSGYAPTINGNCVQQDDALCLIYNEEQICAKCWAGMEISPQSKKCVQASRVCLDIDIKTGECRMCLSGYYLSQQSGNCVQIQYCKDSDGIEHRCQVCQHSYHLVQNESDNVYCKLNDFIIGCILTDGIYNMCQICSLYYDLQEGKCVPMIPHNGIACKVYGFYLDNSDDEYCKEHSEEVKLNCFLLDSQSNRCVKCLSGNFLNKQKRCVPIVNCSFSDGYSKFCFCANQYDMYIDAEGVPKKMENSRCYTNLIDPICIVANGFGGIQSILMNEDGSLLINEEDITNQERDYMALTDHNCFIFQKQPQNSDPIMKCVKCSNMYYLNAQSICEKVSIRFCFLSDRVANRCILCTNFYDIDRETGQCVPVQSKIHYCEEYDEYQTCKKCESLFYLQSHMCTAVRSPMCRLSQGIVDLCMCDFDFTDFWCKKQYCQKVDSTTNRCIQCIPNYSLQPELHTFSFVNFSIHFRITKSTIYLFSYYIITYVFLQYLCTLLKNDQCVSNNILNCKKTDAYFNCLECMDGFVKPLASSVQGVACFRISIPHCLKMKDFSQNCIQCEQGYFLSRKGFCYQLKNCQSFNKSCTHCIQPYILNEYYNCIIIPNCLKTEGIHCILCESTYFLSQTNQECYPIKHCSISSGISQECEACLPNFSKIGYRCVADNQVDYCVDYNDQSQCISCQNLYYLDENSRCIQMSSIHYCAKSDGKTKVCSQCQTNGFALNDSNECVSIPNCVISDGIKLCLFCARLFYRRDGFLKISPFNINKVCLPRLLIDNCVYYDQNENVCQQCQNKYYLSADRKSCLQFPSNLSKSCFLSEGMTDDCLICKNIKSPYISQITLKKIPPRAQFYEFSSKTCSFNEIENYLPQCSPNYYSIQLVIYPNPIVNCLQRTFQTDNCRLYSTHSNDCEICAHGYTLRNTSELPYGSYCEPIPSTDLVENCAEYHENTNICLACKTNNITSQIEFWLDKSSNKCLDIIDKNCASVYANSPICISDFIPHCSFQQLCDGERCKEQRCLKCEQGYFLSGINCEKLNPIQHCARLSLEYNQLCLECEKGYVSIGVICESFHDQNCLFNKGRNRQQCSICKDGFASGSYLCQPTKLKNCKTVGMFEDFQLCVSCQVGFEQDAMRHCIRSFSFLNPSCASHQSNRCLVCQEGYFLNKDSQCLKYDSVCSLNFCEVCSEDSQPDTYQCQTCRQGYYVGEGKKCFKQMELKSDEKEEKTNPIQSQKPTQQHKSSTVVIFIISIVIFALMIVAISIIRMYQRRKQEQAKAQQSQIEMETSKDANNANPKECQDISSINDISLVDQL